MHAFIAEFLTGTPQNKVEESFWQKIKTFFRNFFNDLTGYYFEINDDDLRALLRMSYNNLINNKNHGKESRQQENENTSEQRGVESTVRASDNQREADRGNNNNNGIDDPIGTIRDAQQGAGTNIDSDLVRQHKAGGRNEGNNRETERTRTDETRFREGEAIKQEVKAISDFVRDVLDGKIKDDKRFIELPEVINRLAEKRLGHKISSHNIVAHAIRHSWKNHGKGTKKKNSEDLMTLEKKDFPLMPYIMYAPDRIEKGTTENGRESIKYYKNLSDGYVVVVEREGVETKSDMENINMWGEDKKSQSPYVAYAPNNRASRRTPKTLIISPTDVAKIMQDFDTAIKKQQNTDNVRYRNGENQENDYDFDVSGLSVATADNMQQIKTGAQKNKIFMLDREGKPTNLDEKQWLYQQSDEYLNTHPRESGLTNSTDKVDDQIRFRKNEKLYHWIQNFYGRPIADELHKYLLKAGFDSFEFEDEQIPFVKRMVEDYNSKKGIVEANTEAEY
ncbi:MAG: hypothetical protein LBC98_01025, partial [Prevotellaceae bacterium]|nr:hypothetical protein [Prevotellaceae bacterium]